jgi:predicted transcriptional regulator
MSHAFTLTLPDELYESIRRNAQATHQPPESMLLRSLRVSLPSLDGLPAAMAEDLVQLEALDDEALRAVVHETVEEDESDEIEELLEKNRAGTLAGAELDRLDALRRKADRTMLRKARAAVLLRFRGKQVPTIAELRERWTTPG